MSSFLSKTIPSMGGGLVRKVSNSCNGVCACKLPPPKTNLAKKAIPNTKTCPANLRIPDTDIALNHPKTCSLRILGLTDHRLSRLNPQSSKPEIVPRRQSYLRYPPLLPATRNGLRSCLPGCRKTACKPGFSRLREKEIVLQPILTGRESSSSIISLSKLAPRMLTR